MTRSRNAVPFFDRHDDLRRKLAIAGCVACRVGEWSEERFLFAFLHESYTDANLLDRLSDSLGFCAAHSRLVFRKSEATWVMQGVGADIVREAHRRWDRWLVRSALDDRRPMFPAACPMCDNRERMVGSLIRMLVPVLDDGRDRAGLITAYRTNGGLCIAHARTALMSSPMQAARTIIDGLNDALVQQDGCAPIAEPLVSRDADAAARAPLRRAMLRVATSLAARESHCRLLDALMRRFAIPSCPCCLAIGVSEWRALSWVAAESARDLAAVQAEGITLCTRHLHDVAVDDCIAAARLATLERARTLTDLGAIRARFAIATGPRFATRLRAACDVVTGPPRRSVAYALGGFLEPRECFVCRAMRIADGRERVLVCDALRDAPTRTRYEASHGLCVRHALSVTPLDRTGSVARTLGARLAVLRWELDEAERRLAWPERFDRPRSMPGAWLRAGAQLDGRIFLGGPAVSLG